MIWIVTILATLMYLGFGVIYAAGFSKRKHFRWSMLITAAAIFLTQAGMFFGCRRKIMWEPQSGWDLDTF